MHLPSLLTSITLLTTAIAAPSSLKPRQGGWTVRDFTRDCADDGDNGPNSCTYVFTIDTSEVSQQCLIVDSAPQASLHSFYSVPCTENADYHISWGWNIEQDFTVMTVVYETAQLEAFFGYSHPNAGPGDGLPDVGPNPVHSTGVPP